MKKALSLILAVIIVASMLPTVAVASTTEPHTITYLFHYDAIKPNDVTADSTSLSSTSNYSNEGNNFRYHNKTGLSNNAIYENFLKFTTSKGVIHGALWLDIDVDKTASYTLTVNYNKSGNYNGGLRIYIVDEKTRTGNGWTTMTSFQREARENLQPIDNVTIDTKTAGSYTAKESISLEKGTYNLLLRLEGVEQPGVESDSIVRTQANLTSIVLTEDTTVESGVAVSGNIKVGLGAYEGGSVALNGSSEALIAENAESGTEFTATATASEGYRFAYWKDSAGKVVSTDKNYNFKAYTNTGLIAVFDKAETGNAVEFFDADGNYVGLVSDIADGTTFAEITPPTIENNNYTLAGWSIDAATEIRGVMRAVAEYSVSETAIDGVTVTTPSATDKTVSYGQEFAVTSSAADFSAWARNNKLVTFDKAYTYYAFDSASITEVNGLDVTKAPIVVLDTHQNASYADTYMIEYDAAGRTILEAGIIFGDDTHNTVTSCYYKAKVRNLKEHGQFIARTPKNAEYATTTVRGYLIYDDNGTAKVIYSK